MIFAQGGVLAAETAAGAFFVWVDYRRILSDLRN